MNTLKLLTLCIAVLVAGCCKPDLNSWCQAPADITVPHPQIEKDGHAMDHYMVVFSASWCGPCQRMKPDVKALGKEGVLIYTIDTDDEKNGGREAAVKMGVKSLPTIVVMAGGKEQARVVGRQTLDQLRELYGANDAPQPDDTKPIDDDDPGIDLPKKPLDYKVF